MERDTGHAGLLHQPARERDAGAVAGLAAGAELHGHRQAAALARGARDGHGAVVVVEEGGAGAGPADLAHRAAHVEVDEVGARAGGDRGRLAHHRGVVAEELHRHRVLVGVDAQELAQRAPVAVHEAEARDHLRDHEPGAVALRLKAHEPVADAGQRREHDAVGEAHAAERPAVRQGAHTEKVAPDAACERRQATSRGRSPSGSIGISFSACTSSTEAAHADGRPGDGEASAVGAGLAGGAHDHPEAVQVHEVHVAQIEDHAPLAVQQAGDRLAHPRRGRRVHLALDLDDHRPPVVVERNFEWVWRTLGGQSASSVSVRPTVPRPVVRSRRRAYTGSGSMGTGPFSVPRSASGPGA